MKLLSLVGTAAAASASSSSITSPAAESTFVLSRGLSSSSSSSSSAIMSSSSSRQNSQHRTLEDANGFTYTYLNDLSGYSLAYSHCVRVKIPQQNDDDAVEGNTNFYNGRYHAQYSIYATFHVCGAGNYDASAQCYANNCNYDVEYAAPIADYLGYSLNYFYGDNDNYNNNNNNGQVDESSYIECAAAFQEDDMQLYYGPQCSDDGTSIVIGVFYDDECTIKTKHDSPDLGYNKFATIESGCVDCSSDTGAEICTNMYGNAYHCALGKDQRGQQDDYSVCSTIKKAMSSVDYSHVKKRHAGADMFLKAFFVFLACSSVAGFFFLSYSYYIRHIRLDEAKVEGEEGEPRSEYTLDSPVANGGGTMA